MKDKIKLKLVSIRRTPFKNEGVFKILIEPKLGNFHYLK
jgi:hypothetical protein